MWPTHRQWKYQCYFGKIERYAFIETSNYTGPADVMSLFLCLLHFPPTPPFFQLSEGRSKRPKRQIVVVDSDEVTQPQIIEPQAAITLAIPRNAYLLVRAGSA